MSGLKLKRVLPIILAVSGSALLSLPGLSLAQDKPVASAKAADAEGKALWDGETLAGWKRTEFKRGGEVTVDKAFKGAPAIILEAGPGLSGLQYTGQVPKTNYEISLETMKIKGDDFMCALTFPVADSHATLVLGGWGGGVVGISSIDNADASENPTTRFMSFALDRWYKVRLRVTPKKLEAWLDDQQIINEDITDRRISLRPGEIHMQVPLGLSSYQTKAAYRNIRLKALK